MSDTQSRTFADLKDLAVAAGAKHDPEPMRRMRAKGIEDFFEPIRGMRVIDIDRRAIL